ncbi:MAG: TlpA disulfide reductase family protein [Betaproteobacteria bacterium]
MGLKPILALGVALMVTLAGIAVWVGRSPAGDGPQPASTANHDASVKPDVSAGAIYTARFTDTKSQEHSLGEWQHKLLLINFWATWCGPCKEEMPILRKLQEKHAEAGLQVIGIAADSRVNVINFAEKLPTGYPLFPDEGGAVEFSKRLGNRLGLLPFTVIVRPGGEVIFTRLGTITEEEISQLVAKSASK